jgi:CP family cyanate transporter-like MFS transporter
LTACRWPRRSRSRSWSTPSCTRPLPRSSGKRFAPGRTVGALAVPVVLTGLNLRPLFGSLPPLLQDIRDDLGLSAAAAGLLTTGPLLALGILAPLGPQIARRYATERVLLVACFVTAVGTAARGLGGVAPLYLGTLLAGAAIALTQVVTPSWVRAQDTPGIGVLTGAFSWALVAGATIATFIAIPLEHAFGGWQGALAVWGIVGVVAAAVWVPRAITAHTPLEAPEREPLWRSPMAWSIAGLMGLQSLAFFSTITWLPDILVDDGYSEGVAGTMSGITQLVQLVPAFAIPVLAARRTSQVDLLNVIVATALIGLAGVLALDDLAPLWMVFLGIGQGGALGLALMLPVLRGRSPGEVAGMAAMAMGVGYLIAAGGPALVGAVFDLTGAWTAPLIVLLAFTVAQWPAALYAVKGKPT